MNEKIIILKPTPARKRALMVNDALPGVLLLINGLGALGEESSNTVLTYLNIAAGVAVIVALVYEWKRGNSESHRIVSWFDVIAGMVLIVEAINRHHPGRWFQPAIFYFLIGVLTIVRGLFHSRFPSFRRLVLDEKGFVLRTSPFRRLKLNWDEVDSVSLEGMILSVKIKNGKTHTISLRRVENREEIVEGIHSNL